MSIQLTKIGNSPNTPVKEFVCDTRELKAILGDVPLDTYDVSQWILEFIKENTEVCYK